MGKWFQSSPKQIKSYLSNQFQWNMSSWQLDSNTNPAEIAEAQAKELETKKAWTDGQTIAKMLTAPDTTP